MHNRGSSHWTTVNSIIIIVLQNCNDTTCLVWTFWYQLGTATVSAEYVFLIRGRRRDNMGFEIPAFRYIVIYLFFLFDFQMMGALYRDSLHPQAPCLGGVRVPNLECKTPCRPHHGFQHVPMS